MSDWIGRRLGDYQVLRRLGSGGMADVYAARQLKLQRDVALKVLRENQRGTDEDVKRFRREAQAAAKLNHPSIVQVYEIGEAEGTHFIAQELIDGVNLSVFLQQQGQLSPEQAIDVLQTVTSALDVAHAAGVTHRDIKPENLMRADRSGAIKVTDFGLARMLASSDLSTANLTRAGLTLGTPRYMSPEQIQGHTVDGRSDLYSLGVTMYHLLAGRPPFDADEPLALAVKHLHETPPPLDHVRGRSDLPDWLVAMVMRMLAKSPADRFASANEVLTVIGQHTGQVSRSPASPTLPAVDTASATIALQRVTDAMRQQTRRARRRWITTTAAAGIGAMIGLAGAMTTRPASIGQTLRGTTVQQGKTVTEQYLIALMRDDEAGWQAVSENFGNDIPEASTRSVSDTLHRADLQLTRWYIDQGRFREATRTLDELERDAMLSRLHQALAMTLRYKIAKSENSERRQVQAKESLRKLVTPLQQENGAAMKTFNEVVPESLRMEMGIVQ